MQFADVEYKVKISQASSNNLVKAVVSKVAFQFEHDNYKQILKGSKPANVPIYVWSSKVNYCVREKISHYFNIPFDPMEEYRLISNMVIMGHDPGGAAAPLRRSLSASAKCISVAPPWSRSTAEEGGTVLGKLLDLLRSGGLGGMNFNCVMPEVQCLPLAFHESSLINLIPFTDISKSTLSIQDALHKVRQPLMHHFVSSQSRHPTDSRNNDGVPVSSSGKITEPLLKNFSKTNLVSLANKINLSPTKCPNLCVKLFSLGENLFEEEIKPKKLFSEEKAHTPPNLGNV
ncbi:hypothetical protein RND71_003441 [Anisodus tanguticus]|uniref:Uncharacterized protein n=1 Tax=Anisodus tanguticus TaxID=243964 RepID=A0AAE1SVW1_9SOLA|nr:hypothetical protein RND71_003441 [Anisodus tanguticus]